VPEKCRKLPSLFLRLFTFAANLERGQRWRRGPTLLGPPPTGGNQRGVANDRDEIAVTSRLHPDDAKAILGVLVGDALDQPSKHLPIG
jgi:hypothetical protein